MIERRLFSDMWILYPEALASMAMNTSDNYMLNKVFDWSEVVEGLSMEDMMK